MATPQAGDKVIYRKSYGEKPVETTVLKVTPAGRIYTVYNPPLLFKLVHSHHYEPANDRKNHAEVYAWSQDVWDKMVVIHQEHEAHKAAKAAQREKSHKEMEERLATELAEVRQALGGNVYATVRYQKTMPGGDKLFLLHLPVKAEYQERKGPVEVVLVHLKPEKDTDWKTGTEKDVVGLYYTSAHAATRSFPSCSGSRFADEETALWAAARAQYHNW